MIYFTIYLAAVSLLAVVLTIYDKSAAKKQRRRTKENTLLLVSLLGGSIAMLMAMQIIRHKTKHAKFMVGIPVIIILQIAAGLFIWWKLKGCT